MWHSSVLEHASAWLARIPGWLARIPAIPVIFIAFNLSYSEIQNLDKTCEYYEKGSGGNLGNSGNVVTVCMRRRLIIAGGRWFDE